MDFKNIELKFKNREEMLGKNTIRPTNQQDLRVKKGTHRGPDGTSGSTRTEEQWTRF